MPESPWTEIGPLAIAFGLVAGVAVPVGVLLRLLAGPDRTRLRLQKLHDLEVIILIALAFVLPSLLHSTLRTLNLFNRLGIEDLQAQEGMARIGALALWLGFIVLWLHQRGQNPFPRYARSLWLRDIASGITAFLILTPITFTVFFAASLLLQVFGGTPDRHPLTDFNLSTPLGLGCFILLPCVVAPIFEESIFRGLLLPWARQRKIIPWLLFALAVVMLLAGKGWTHLGTWLFLVDLGAIMVLAMFGREIWKKWPTRSASALFTTSALFGAMHSAVWPTPIPLTVLGLGLGYVTLKRGSVRPAIVCHTLFNAVSVVYVLRRSL